MSEPRAAGIILREPDGRLLFLRRSPESADHPEMWCWPGGGIEDGEVPEEAARRELAEETGIKFTGPLAKVDDRDGFVTFFGNLPERCVPELNDEHTDGWWMPQADPPQPIHPGVAATLSEIDLPKRGDMASDAALRRRDRMSFDRASVRRFDETSGHLHVSVTPISKATVNPYYGREVPGFKDLGLEPDKVYQVFRPPEELEKGAASFAGKPLLIIHKPVSADDHPREVVVGSIGSNVTFKAPYLQADLVVWDGEAIAGIESDEQRELSCGYAYTPVLQSGTYQGQPYEIVMTGIHGNHVALVEEGRAGPDVLVGDEKPKGQPMKLITKALPSRKALLVQGALSALLAPKLATDAKLDLSLALDGVTRSNFKAKKPTIAKSLEKALGGKLAQDEGLGEVVEAVAELLDNLDGVQSGEPDDDDLSADEDETEKKDEDKDGAKDEDPAKILEDLKGKVSEETYAKVAAELAGGAQDEDKDEEKKDDDKVDQGAMDAAIRAAETRAEKRAVARMNAIATAKAAVRPHVGELAGAFDSAEEIYKLALDHAIESGADIDLAGVPASAYAAIVAALPKPDATKPTARREQAHDAKLADELFPGLARIKHV